MTCAVRCYDMLDALCPMHLVLSGEGLITHAGPTIVKISPVQLIGRSFLNVFEIKRPREISHLAAIKRKEATKLHLQFRRFPHRLLKGVLVPGPAEHEMTINLSFGISVVDAVQDHKLTAADFAATDLAVEMLYLVEAKSAAMEASRKLNERLQSAKLAAEELALRDTLTGLVNRRSMDQDLAALISAGQPFSLMHIDLDYFKLVNDTKGHAAGDAVLQRVSRVMLAKTRDRDIVARVGGDEFVVVLRGAIEHATLTGIAEQIIEGISHPMHFADGDISPSCSIGIARSDDYAVPDADQILRDADIALYAAKHSGRGRSVHYSPNLRGNLTAGV